MKRSTIIKKLKKIAEENKRWNAIVEHLAGICDYETRTYGESRLTEFVKKNTPIVEYKIISNLKEKGEEK